MIIKPITFREASEYVNNNHRHNKATVGCKFCISVWDENVMHGVAICGRPVGRKFDDGETCEINRVCTDGYRNACSKLYGACVRIARDMGYKRVITYTLEDEDGASLKASNFVYEGLAGKDHWTGERNKGQDYIPHGLKKRWAVYL